ncbi:MAG: 2-keto-3-deoxy-6-phosphogluconate aldolase [Paraglaciecola sp.]|jgi:2-keto-3-deoxy-6-phosphogluconate aldolase
MDHLRALKAVLPEEIKLYPVGGVEESNLASWITTDGAEFGSSLYRTDDDAPDRTSPAITLQQYWRDNYAG